MKLKAIGTLAFALLIAAGSAHASLIVNSIDVSFVNTRFNAKTLPDGMLDEDKLALAFSEGFLPSFNDPDKHLCTTSLAEFDAINSRETCGGPRRNLGSLFMISGYAEHDSLLQLGLDWGLGGFLVTALGDHTLMIDYLDSDIWWKKRWSDSDVVELFLPAATEFVLMGLGFERCCDGYFSGRWRSLEEPDESLPGTYATHAVGREAPMTEWNLLQVNAPPAQVPAPAGGLLMGIGLLALACSRRRRANT